MTQRMRYGAVAAAALLGTAAAACAGPASGPPVPHGPRGGSASAAAPARGFTLAASGDILPHESVIGRARADADGDGHDFAPMLAAVEPVVSGADVAICHMETVYGEEEGPFTGYPDFVSPPEVAQGLKDTGYDSCSTASNHALDDGSAGVRRTLDALDKAGVRHTGTARSAAEATRPALLTAGGARIAQLAYTYGVNDHPFPDGQPWAVALVDEKKIVADARAARKAGADVVVVSLHWGTEWQTAPDEIQLDLGRRLTASRTGTRPDIDLILGTHAHVPQAYEKVNGTWIIYGMGDQIAGVMTNDDGELDGRGNQGSIGRFTFAPPAAKGQRWPVRRAEFVPQLMDTGTGRVVNLREAVRADPERDDYREVLDDISATVLSRGAAADGLALG
ncbi:CapA family protein [Streptomyces corynorhini]|uniref:CapA family protein n=1 Tax=Streptomyces corynorhini TaxID=2282652 RepID=A0A370B114_9ACTN|nr:CapA family protein [Streptomyces corynorhini]RDG35538.1 CapA family protein [Streptomyces corynorhini]